jgi:hypothetical protein
MQHAWKILNMCNISEAPNFWHVRYFIFSQFTFLNNFKIFSKNSTIFHILHNTAQHKISPSFSNGFTVDPNVTYLSIYRKRRISRLSSQYFLSPHPGPHSEHSCLCKTDRDLCQLCVFDFNQNRKGTTNFNSKTQTLLFLF